MSRNAKRRLQGAKAGDRDQFVRFRVSAEEKEYIDQESKKRGEAMSYSIRLALINHGLLPVTTPLDDKSTTAEFIKVISGPRKRKAAAS